MVTSSDGSTPTVTGYQWDTKGCYTHPAHNDSGNPDGTPVSGLSNTFDYPILSSVTLTCMVTSDNGSPFTVTNYHWDTTRCFTNDRHPTPTCFPTGQTTQSVTGNNLLAKDAGTITCTASVDSMDFTSGLFTLRLSGIQNLQLA